MSHECPARETIRRSLPDAPGGQGGSSDRVTARIFDWLGQNRRLSKHYERLYATNEALIYATMSRLMLR
jgi:hypothetical protein